MTANKINYGLKNVYYSLWTEGSGGTAGSFGTPVAMPGGVKLALTTTGSNTSFYADDEDYVTFTTGSGYEGDLELALIPDSFLTSCLGSFGTDTKGGIYEEDGGVAKQFALLFEVEGDDHNRRYALYNCKAARPALNANTTNDSTNPDTETLTLTCGSHSITSGSGSSAVTKEIVKISMERSTDSATDYDAWFTTVYQPTFAAA